MHRTFGFSCIAILLLASPGWSAETRQHVEIGAQAGVVLPTKTVIVMSGENTSHSMLFKDCLTALLVKRGTKVVSPFARRHAEAEIDRKWREAEEAAEGEQEKETEKKSAEKPRPAPLAALAEYLEADSVIVGSLVLSAVQKNVYEGQVPRVKEVHTGEVIRAASLSVIDPQSGEQIAVAFAEYDEDPGILKVARELTDATFGLE